MESEYAHFAASNEIVNLSSGPYCLVDIYSTQQEEPTSGPWARWGGGTQGSSPGGVT